METVYSYEELQEITLGLKRIPITARRDKKSALEFIIQTLPFNRCHENPDITVLKNWVDNHSEKYSLVKSIEKLDEQETYDLSIVDGASYVANGIYCHNTINLPSNVSVEEVKHIYEKAWETKCKGITVYRDGSRNGILFEEKKHKEEFSIHHALKRPKELRCEVNHITFKGERYYVIIGLWEQKYPYEIFVGKNINLENDSVYIPKEIREGKIKKIKRGNYVLVDNKNIEYPIAGELYDDVVESLTRFVSLSLRHGVDILFIVDTLEKSTGDLFSFSKVMARTLKKYVKNGAEVSGMNCPNCGGEQLIRENGCIRCLDCGYSKCE